MCSINGSHVSVRILYLTFTPLRCLIYHPSITVVQSYFVYWAGIESSLVRDESHGPRTGNNITVMDRRNAVALQEDEVTALAGMQVARSNVCTLLNLPQFKCASM